MTGNIVKTRLFLMRVQARSMKKSEKMKRMGSRSKSRTVENLSYSDKFLLSGDEHATMFHPYASSQLCVLSISRFTAYIERVFLLLFRLFKHPLNSTLSIFDSIKQRKQQYLSNAQIKEEELLSFEWSRKM